jgi:V/A-type H+-transporting ATPase subunit A
MCDVLIHFPLLKDPRTGESLMERTTLIANTSNMPVAAREAGVYTGITIAEYFRDMGYDVALMADSTSRWAEAMREISGRLEEMPGEEGFPAYLASRLAEFYERAGRVQTLGADERFGSVTVLGAVSPPGGDFSEPVSQNTLRIVKVFWALDTNLAYRRHFPAINWLTSYSLYVDNVRQWWKKRTGVDWKSLRDEAIAMLQKEAELEEIVKLVGPDALPEPERAVLEAARIMREDLLQQFAFHEIDTYCTAEKQMGMLEIVLDFYRNAVDAAKRNISVGEIKKLPVKEDIAGMKRLPNERFVKEQGKIEKLIKEQFGSLSKTKKAPVEEGKS